MNNNVFLDQMITKLKWVTGEVDFLYPSRTVNGLYKNAKCAPFSWTTGFYGGILWYLYVLTGEERFRELAKKAAERFDEGLTEYTWLSHDVGFQFLPTSVADYMLTRDERSKVRALHAATILAGRYNPKGQFIRAWNDNPGIDSDMPKTGYVIIDCMMNTPLLYWASEVTGDPRFRQIANLHADTVIRHFVREDGSVNHIVVFDPETGAVISKPMGQGYAEGSSWTRGQAWAIYGFAMAYHYTGEPRYLETAKKVGDYFAAHMNAEYMPVDFAQPAEPKYEDCSAAAIAACGYMEIGKYVKEDNYAACLEVLMDILYRNCDFTDKTQSVLQNCSEMYHGEGKHGISLIYGDFYLLEALARLHGKDALFYKK